MEEKKVITTESGNDSVKSSRSPGANSPRNNKRTFGFKHAGIVALSFIAGIAGSWVGLGTGIVKPDVTQTITQNRDKIVLQQGEIFADVAERVSPSVVSIVTEINNDTPFGNFSNEGAGTGIIISKDGYVLTNKHVIPENATSVSVVQSDGTLYENVSVVGRDPLNDIAFLKINDVNDLVAAELGDSGKVQIGQQVIAIGNALGQFRNTVTSGIISGLGRPITAGSGTDAERLEDLFQTDTAINPGNSGGPLLNLDGQVIGVNTAIAQRAEGIGFAIPINSAKGLIKTVTTDGKVSRAYIGVRYVTIDAELAKDRNLPVKRGAYIASQDEQNAVVPGGPADKAGIKNNDIIVKVNDTEINDRRGLAGLLAEFTPGDTVTLTILREGKQMEIKVKLEELRR